MEKLYRVFSKNSGGTTIKFSIISTFESVWKGISIFMVIKQLSCHIYHIAANSQDMQLTSVSLYI